MKNKASQSYLLYIFVALGLIWLKSSWGKLSGGDFVGSLGSTLTRFASQNPYPWYKDFLTSFAIPNSQVFGQLVLWGELLVALGLILIPLYLIFQKKSSRTAYLLLAVSFFGAVLLSVSFWLAAGWTSPSTESVNLLMLLIEAIGLIYSYRKYQTS